MALIVDINKQRVNDRAQKYKFDFLTKKKLAILAVRDNKTE